MTDSTKSSDTPGGGLMEWNKLLMDHFHQGCILKFTGLVFASNPPKYQHECNNCNNLASLNEKYPIIRYEFED